MKTNYKKVLRELKIYKGRTLLALLGVLIGISSIGFVLSSYSILMREMNSNYMNTNPASIVLKVQNLDQNALNLIKDMKKNITVEVRKTIVSRIDRDDGTYGTLYLFAIENFSKLKVDTFTLENGVFPNAPNQMALERDSLKNLLNLKKGYEENVRVSLPGGHETSMQLSGKVHAPGLPPASMEKFSYGFVSLKGLQSLGYNGWYDEIRLVSYDNRFDRESLKNLSSEMKALLTRNSYIVEKISVPEPGKHPHGDQLKSLLFLLQAFTVISLLVACIIIVNLLNFIMSTQTKQIAIMKATGANTWDIALPYFLYVLLISFAAILISFPIAAATGSEYAHFAANILNFNINSGEVPFWVFAIQLSAGIVIPLSASFYPIYKSCNITVKQGLAEPVDELSKYSNRVQSFAQKWINKANLKLAIPLNNVFRKKGRALLAILALAAGGIVFMTSLNIIASINHTVENSMDTFGYDYDIKLFGQYPDDKILEASSGITGIENVEIYKSHIAAFTKKDGTNSAYYPIKALPKNSKMIDLQVIKGPEAGDSSNSVVINKALQDEEKWIQLGSRITMEIQGKNKTVTIAGIVNEVPPLPCIYISLENYESFYSDHYQQNILISAIDLPAKDRIKITKEIEKSFERNNIAISENWNIGLLRKAFVDHLKVIVSFLSIIALLAVIVGGLSIASAIGITISERKRELGVLKAIGVDRHQMIQMISLEVVLLGIAGWIIGVVLSYPVSIWTGNYFGQIFLHSDLNNVISTSGIFIWLSISILVSYVSGLIPVINITKVSLKEMLSYE